MSLSLYAPKDYTDEARRKLRQTVGEHLATFYALLKMGDEIPINAEQERIILRRFGKSLDAVSGKVADMIEDGKDLFAGFPYAPEQYRSTAEWIEDLSAAKERLDEASARIGQTTRALRVILGTAVLEAIDTQDSLARNRTLDAPTRQRAADVGAPVRAVLSSRNEATQRNRMNTIQLKGKVADAEGAAAEAQAEAERLEDELSATSVVEDRLTRAVPLAARNARRGDTTPTGQPTGRKTRTDRRRKDR